MEWYEFVFIKGVSALYFLFGLMYDLTYPPRVIFNTH